MTLRLILSIFFAAGFAQSMAEDRSTGVEHLIPPSGLHDFDHSWDYDAKLRAILLKDAPARPAAFALVRTGPGRPEYCVYLLKDEDGSYTVEARQAARHIWYDKSSDKNPVETFRKGIPREKGDEIANLWEEMLRRVKHPTPGKKKQFVLDAGSTYYACFKRGEGILGGETPNYKADGGDLGKMSSFTHWMAMHCMGKSFNIRAPKGRKLLKK